MMNKSRFRMLLLPITLIVGAVLLTGCNRTMVFGENTGFNLGVSVDAAKSLPVEVNTGFKRQVVGIIPSSEDPVNGRARGESTSMISRFQLGQERKTEGDPFDNRITISSAFASGKAAVTVIEESEDPVAAVNAIVQAKKLTASTEPTDVAVRQRLVNFVNTSNVNLQTYLAMAEQENLTVLAGLPAEARAANAIIDQANTQGNKKILKRLQDLNLV
ncbi:MAG: hypothetical protein GY952_06285 [Rhodobacteraceae bacterium]|nr:hypothetical protein [Paracoccaceae bacterium]